MSIAVKHRSASAPVERIDRNENHKQTIYKEDLKMFVDKYIKDRSFFNSFFELPKEIYLLKLISDKQENLWMQRTPIDDTEMKLFFKMIDDNKKDRVEKPRNTPRLRDVVIDHMLRFIRVEKATEGQYCSLRDFF